MEKRKDRDQRTQKTLIYMDWGKVMAKKLSTAPYRGTRDFLPDQMSPRTQIFSTLYSVIESFGFIRYDGPTLEALEIYEAKSGQEIVDEQIYHLIDRGGRRLAIRPEMTPSVARMIAGHADQLHFPVRWYCNANCYRYERPQRGRLREHRQINVDIFGSDSPEAEAEIFSLVCQMFDAVGAKPSDFLVRVSDRILVSGALKKYAAIADQQIRAVFKVIDRWEKYSVDANQEALSELGLDPEQVERIAELVKLNFDEISQLVDAHDLAISNVAQVLREGMVEGPIVFDPMIVRGFDYYTSTVFEVFDVLPENKRSLFGGGRYDNLLALFSNQRISGIGFGMGDVTLFDFLDLHSLVPQAQTNPDVYVMPLTPKTRQLLGDIAKQLRMSGLRVITPLVLQNMSKDLKDAAKRKVRYAIILGEEELEHGTVIVRDLENSAQETILLADLVQAIVNRRNNEGR